MKFTTDWLKDHLKTNKTEAQIVEKLNNTGLEVEKVEPLKNEFSDFIQLPTCPKNRTHTFMLYGVLLKKQEKSDLVNYLENLNIETRDLLPLINQPIYRKLYGNIDKEFPVADKINKSGFYR